MATARDIADRIEEAAACLHQHGHDLVADGLQLVLAGADDLPSAMGAASGWRSAARLKARDAALAELVRLHGGYKKVLPLAGRIASLITNYHATAWPADRRAGRRPDDPRRGAAFDFLVASRPLSVHMIRKLLSNAGNEPARDYQDARAA